MTKEQIEAVEGRKTDIEFLKKHLEARKLQVKYLDDDLFETCDHRRPDGSTFVTHREHASPARYCTFCGQPVPSEEMALPAAS